MILINVSIAFTGTKIKSTTNDISKYILVSKITNVLSVVQNSGKGFEGPQNPGLPVRESDSMVSLNLTKDTE